MGSVQFQVVPCFSLSFFSMFIGPRVLICCTCYFQSDFFFVYFGFLYLRVSSGSNKGAKVVTYLGSLVHLCPGQGGTWQTNITGMCGPGGSVWASLKPAHRVGPFLIYTAQAPGCSAGELSKAGPGLCALPRSKLLRFGSRVLHKGTDSVGPAFCALPWYEHSGD